IDHHELPEGDTAAYALVNSRRPDDAFPFKGLASCGVAFYLAAALRRSLGSAFDPRELLDLVALGTIADLVPLVAENRILVAAGLQRLSLRDRPGLAALAARAQLEGGRITAHDAAFRLTPRLNAAGRLGEAQLALHLTKFGGHAVAAGMSLGFGELDGFRAAFAAEAARQLGAAASAPTLAVDAEVTLRDLDLGFTEELARLGPFGVANREPL